MASRASYRRAVGTLVICSAQLSLVLPIDAFSACSLEKYAELPVTMNGRQPIIEGSINGTAATFLADSGGFYSLLWTDRVGRFKLHLSDSPNGLKLQGVGGIADTQVTTIDDFSLRGLGGSVFHKVHILVAGQAIGTADGIIGQNILGRADTEYDLGNGVIRMYHSTGCENYSLAYWRGSLPVSEMSIRPTTDRDPQLIGSAKLNGLGISVLFDTGSTNSTLRLKAAIKAGFDPSRATRNTYGRSGLGPRGSEFWLTRFDNLDLGGEDIKNVRMVVSDSVTLGDWDLILGADFFLSHRVYIASNQHKIYFTYSGGPVFDLPDGDASLGSPEVSAASKNESPSALPEDPAQYMRRGAAFAARGDLASAIADFDMAIRLNPDDAESFYRRGNAKSQIHQSTEAEKDFDQALKLQPSNAPWLRARAVLRLTLHDDPGAAADFDAWARLIPPSDNPELDIAEDYARNDRFQEAIGELDRWIDSHLKDPSLSAALNNRCWFRAEAGKELDKALADCNAAFKLDPRDTERLNSRALVYLRMGEYDKSMADYKEDLRRRPKSAWSLYGLGLAQLRNGENVQADSNMKKALAIDSEIAERFRKFGVAP